MFHTATPEDILAGRTTDIYFERTLQILRAKGVRKQVKAEFIVKSLPFNDDWAVLAGIEEAVELLKALPVKVRAMEEGSIFRPFQPILEIEGDYADFCIHETALLGFLCQASGVATKAARCRKLAGEKTVLSFGARRMHPTVAPVVERSAYLGGCDGVSVVQSAELVGVEPTGTMPHALVIIMGGMIPALMAFHEVIDPRVRRVALIDTFNDEKFEAINVAEALGKDLFGVRLDTPASRRGNFRRIIEEVRWELDLRGYSHVKLFVSGGLDEKDIVELNPVVDGYGVGTSISNAPVIDLAMDIIEVEGAPLAKRGKMSGSKDVIACPSCGASRIVPMGRPAGKPVGDCECGGAFVNRLVPILDHGRLLVDLPTVQEIRAKVVAQLHSLAVTL